MAGIAVARSMLRPRSLRLCVRGSQSLVRCWARPVTTSAAAWSDNKGGEFMNKEKFDSMVPKDGLGDLDVDVPVIEAGKKNYSPRVTELATQILELNLLEIADLCDILKDRLDMNDDAMFFPMPNLAGMVMAGGGGGGEAAEEAAPVEEKTHFDLKLVTFDAKAKIKIIKEVRAATKLGLKEAKDLVESAPAVLLKDASKDDAEPLKAKLEELGATMELE